MRRNLMNLKELIAKLPEGDRGEAERVIQEAIIAGNPIAGIDTKEKAVEFINRTPVFEQAAMFLKTTAIELHDAKFQKEKLPGLVEAEIKKRNPEKDPLRIELDALKAEREAEKAELKRERLKALAIKRAADEGIPVDDIERFIGEDEDRTAASVDGFAKRLKAYADAKVEAALKEKLGNNGQPRGGNAPQAPGDLESQYLAAVKDGNADLALVLQGKLQAAGRKT
jgi:hypothetical protein